MAAVRVLHNYGGVRTNEARILPAVYAADDDALFGLADYLVTNGHAEWVDSEPAPAPPPEPAWELHAEEELEFKGRKIKPKKV